MVSCTADRKELNLLSQQFQCTFGPIIVHTLYVHDSLNRETVCVCVCVCVCACVRAPCDDPLPTTLGSTGEYLQKTSEVLNTQIRVS